MKNKISFLICCIMWMLSIPGCQGRQADIPPEYVVDKSLYLSDGDGIYAFIENEAVNHEIIGTELSNGNAIKIKEQYENRAGTKENPQEYATIQNILGITEIYLGDYERAYEYFNDAITVLHELELTDKNKLLPILYNNAGAVTLNLYRFATNDERLEKAAALCKDPYLRLVISANQSCRLREYATEKEWGETILQFKELIQEENQLEDSSYFVTFFAARYMGVGYMLTGQEERGIKVLDEYIPLVPETANYNMIKCSLLGQRGHCYYRLGEYDKSIKDTQEAVFLAERTVGKNSQQLAYEYIRLATGYVGKEEWSTALPYLEKALPGYKQKNASAKGTLYFNIGYVCWELKEYEKAKMYFLKSYVEVKAVIEDVGNAVGEGYDSDIKERLHEIYQSEDCSVSFTDWLEQELNQMEQ